MYVCIMFIDIRSFQLVNYTLSRNFSKNLYHRWSGTKPYSVSSMGKEASNQRLLFEVLQKTGQKLKALLSSKKINPFFQAD
jgi:hypothetical protein